MKYTKQIFFILSITISLFINLKVFHDAYSPTLICLWLLSTILMVTSVIPNLPLLKQLQPRKRSVKITKKVILFIFIIILPSLVRIANYNLGRNHILIADDLITAYFSATHNFLKINFFSGVPVEKVHWVAQFPTPFFVLQKIFFLAFGENLLTIKLSVLPYVFIVSLMLFLIVKEIFNKKTAAISVILYSFFTISLYFETLGLHFISSTAIFIIFFYLLLLNLRQNTPFYSALVGISCGFCYLFYTTSYIAFPFLILFFSIQLIKIRRFSIVKNFLITMVAFLIVLSPFLTYAYKFDNYFNSRIKQVSLLTGEWSEEKNRIKSGENAYLIIKGNLLKSIKSLYRNEIGGHGGYNFGRLAFFDRFSLYLFILGCLIGIILLFKKVEMFFIFLVIIISFITGIALTIPPPAYHRFSLAFPFIALIFSLPFYVLLSIKKIPSSIKILAVFILFAIYVFNNQSYFLHSIKDKEKSENLQLARYINQKFPNRNIYVASFPGFAFEKSYYFSPNKRARTIQTDYHNNILKKFNPNEKYVYVIIFPEEFNEKFKKLDGKGTLIQFSENYSLFVN